jgi:hypothetical protein
MFRSHFLCIKILPSFRAALHRKFSAISFAEFWKIPKAKNGKMFKIAHFWAGCGVDKALRPLWEKSLR